MFNKLLKKEINRIKYNNKGLALVTVIVAIGFVATLVSILLMTTLVNFKMKATNERSKDTFYTAEQVLDEINIGLQKKVSDAISVSYVEILEDYDNPKFDNDQKKQKIMTTYYENLWESLEWKSSESPSGHGYYDVDKLEELLKATTKWDEAKDFGAIVTAVDINDPSIESKHGTMITYTDSGVVLKNVKIYYKDTKGFVSIIQTDIRLAYPDFDFARSSIAPDVTNYVVIADDGFEASSASDLQLDGNVYANNLKISDNTNFSINKGRTLISKYDIDVNNNSSFATNDEADIWARNIKVKSSDVDISGSTTIANDLNIMGKDSNVKISGQYTGYGYDLVEPDKSSALLINGTNSTINFKGLDSLTIAGLAFVGTEKSDDVNKKFDSEFVEFDREKEKELKNVRTGQSVAVKADQLCYLVPAEIIGVDISKDVDKRKSLYNKNPLTKDEYDTLMEYINDDSDESDYVLIDDEMTIPELNQSLSEYMYEVYEHWEQSGLVYFYLTIDEPPAEDKDELGTPYEFIKNYYGGIDSDGNDDVLKYTDLYLNKIEYPTKQMLTNIIKGSNLNGDKTKADGAGGLEMRLPMGDIPSYDVLDTYDTLFKNLCLKLVKTQTVVDCEAKDFVQKGDIDDFVNSDGSIDVTSLIKSEVVFENIVNVTEFETFCSELAALSNGSEIVADPENIDVTFLGSTGTGVLEFIIKIRDEAGNLTGEINKVALVFPSGITGEYTPDSDVHLVVCGDRNRKIVPNSDFSGLIISDGKVVVENSSENIMVANPDIVKSLLEVVYVDATTGNKTALEGLFYDGKDYIAYSSKKRQDTSLSGLITYENWKKE